MGGTVYEPLAGVKVLSFEIAFALPAGTRTLAELGAEVVRDYLSIGEDPGRGP